MWCDHSSLLLSCVGEYSTYHSAPKHSDPSFISCSLIDNVTSLQGYNFDVAGRPLLSVPETCILYPSSFPLILFLVLQSRKNSMWQFNGIFFPPEDDCVEELGGWLVGCFFKYKVLELREYTQFSINALECATWNIIALLVMEVCSTGQARDLLTLDIHMHIHRLLCCKLLFSPHTNTSTGPIAALSP